MSEFLPHISGPPVEWCHSDGFVDYDTALQAMELRVSQIIAGAAPECIWLLQHRPLITAGTSAKPDDLLQKDRFPVHMVGRGGQYTYHGPGQRIIYVMLDLRRRKKDLRAFVSALEGWIIKALYSLGVNAVRRKNRIGLWVPATQSHSDFSKENGSAKLTVSAASYDEKIAAIGIRVRHWVSFHGIAVNVAPELSHYAAIVPCGISGHGITSLEKLDVKADLADLDSALKKSFSTDFGQISKGHPPEF